MIARVRRCHDAFERWLDDADLTRLDRGLLKASQVVGFAIVSFLVLMILLAFGSGAFERAVR